RWMRNALVLLLLLVRGDAAALGVAIGHPMGQEWCVPTYSPTVPRLLQSTVQSLAMPEQDVKALTREQVLLYLFVLHDHDRNGHLDGLELLQLLAPQGWALIPSLSPQDMSKDGLLTPPELLLEPPKQLLSPGQGQGTPGPPLLPHPREPEVLEGNMGVNGPRLRPAEKQEEGQEALQAEPPQAVTQQAESPDAGLMEAEDTTKIETPEAAVPEAEAGLV
uniref:Uncharacterized protein n=1 Tax=Melopsittacus undulatus TaxID=13146 RepID=A0A8V5FJJ4_MELUD